MDVHDVAVEGLNIGAKTTSFGGPFTHMYAALITMHGPFPLGNFLAYTQQVINLTMCSFGGFQFRRPWVPKSGHPRITVQS